MKPRPSLTEIYNKLDQDESQHVLGSSPSMIPAPTTFQVQHEAIPDHTLILLSQGSYQKPKYTYCSRLGHTVDKCYKKHGFPPRFGRGKKFSSFGTANLVVTLSFSPQVHTSSPADTTSESMTKEQIQFVISYLSTQLYSSGVTPSTDKANAYVSTSAPIISLITGSISGKFVTLFNHSYYDMLISAISPETNVSLRAWIIDSGLLIMLVTIKVYSLSISL